MHEVGKQVAAAYQQGLADARRNDEGVVARVRALADAWAEIPDYHPSEYDRGRVDQRHMAIEELLTAIDGGGS